MTQDQALNTLIQAAIVAQSKGAFTLDEASLVNDAVKAFKPQDVPQEPQPESPDETPEPKAKK